MPKKKSVKSELRRIQKIPQYTRRLMALNDLGTEMWDTCTLDEERQINQVIYDTQVAFYRKNLKYVPPNVSFGWELLPPPSVPGAPVAFEASRLPPSHVVWCERVGKYSTEILLDSLEKVAKSYIPCKEIIFDKIYAELKIRANSLCKTG